MTIRVVIISSHRLLAGMLAQLIRSEPDRFSLVGTVNEPEDGLAEVEHCRPDVVLYDADSGPGPLMRTLGHLHQVDSLAKVLLFGGDENAVPLDEAFLLGARGYLAPNTSPEQLLNAMEKVHLGQVWLDRSATAKIFVDLARKKQSESQNAVAKSPSSLTERELAVVIMVAENSDAPRKVIADRLHISDSTLRNHLSVIYEKVGVNTRSGLVAYALRQKLVNPVS